MYCIYQLVLFYLLNIRLLQKECMRPFSQFGIICTILKKWKTPMEEFYFTKINTSP